MLELKTKEKLAEAARTLAQSYQMVYHNSTLFMPEHFLWGPTNLPLQDNERVYKALDRRDIQRIAARYQSILFASESEMVSFEGMLKQLAVFDDQTPHGVLINVNNSLKVLKSDGTIEDPVGYFYPNYISTPVGRSSEDEKFVFDTIAEWTGGVEEANSILRHLATALAPDWSAIKYVLLLGEGRNGKSVFLSMVMDLFGRENISNVSRQNMSEKSPACIDMNSRLLNIIMDGSAEYVKDSGLEKAVVAGEPAAVRKLYESTLTTVQTNGLFIEALNQEPKTRDKTPALQKRITRFYFENVYEENPAFMKQMRSEEMLGALLSLLIKNFVTQDSLGKALTPTQKSMSLRVDQMWLNSVVLQWLEAALEKTPSIATKLVGADVLPLVQAFIPWADSELNEHYTEADTLQMFKAVFNLRRSTRRNTTPRNYWKIVSVKYETQLLIDRVIAPTTTPTTTIQGDQTDE